MRQTVVFMAPQPVQRSRSIVRMASDGSKRPSFQTVRTPVASDMIAALCRPETWNSGFVTNTQGGKNCASGCGGGASIMPRMPLHEVSMTIAIALRWLCTAPLGRPVVPLV